MGEKDWPTVGSWVWDNFDVLNGVSFLPSADDGHIYEQAPYEDLDSLSYSSLKEAMPQEIDFSFEEDVDNTTASQELACTAGVCEI